MLERRAHEIRLLQPGTGKAETLQVDCKQGDSVSTAQDAWRAPGLAPGLAWHCPGIGISVWKPDTGLKQYRELELDASAAP